MLGAVVLWAPSFRLSAADAAGACAAPPNFPASIELYRQAFENWAADIRVDDVWTCAPQTPADVVSLANWAHANGYTLRPRGHMHNWSPLTVAQESTCEETRVVLVDTTRHLTSMDMVSASPAAVSVQAGAALEALLIFLEQAGYGLTATPAPGDLTIGGVLAIAAHGTAVPARGETRVPGHTYGTLSNLVLSLTAVVWDNAQGRYILRTFDRAEPECRALLVHLGRSFVTDVTLQVGANYNLRCVSRVDIPASRLFAGPGSDESRTFASYMDATGRVEAIWFPFTANPWLKVWSIAPRKPLTSRAVSSPYNYPFSDNFPKQVALLADRIISGHGASTPAFGQLMYDVTVAGLAGTLSYDLWGKSKNLLLYVRPSTLRVTANGYAVLTSRANVQQVIADFISFYGQLLEAYRQQGRYPMNGPVEIRVTGLDEETDVALPRAGSPVLSAARPRSDEPAWNVAVWLDILTFPGTPYANQFYNEIEHWAFAHYSGSYAAIRPEWSKGWAYTDAAAWDDSTMLTATIPDLYRVGRGQGDNWDWACRTLNDYDPHRVFSNPFLDTLLP